MSKTEDFIKNTLEASLQPSVLEVINESTNHNVPANSETHFKVVCVSMAFKNQRSVKRHQMAYQLLGEALANGVHALSMHLYTPEEWIELNAVPESPECLGGSGR